MKIWDLLKSFVLPVQMVKYKSMSIAIAICIFVISSFLLGMPVSRNRIISENDIRQNYNYDILEQIPNNPTINNVIADLVNKEIKVVNGRELKCEVIGEIGLYQAKIEFTADNVKKILFIVIDLFDIEQVYLDKEEVNFNPVKQFTVENYPTEDNVEKYLLLLASDALYFQAHPWGTKLSHHGRVLKPVSKKVFYQNNIPDFRFYIENPQEDGYRIGQYLMEQLIIGNVNTIKLKSYTFAFLMGVLFTLITVLILWVFFRRNGIIKQFKEYYNIAAIASVPITVVFFILLWFIPQLLNIYIYVFSLFYLISLAAINNTEDLV
ncbi:MAG: hypothetical protein PHT03_06295 [Bacilli bacterium]|nr:hypothetical protein [Bacilli bacterium]MDD4388999.1 hypothetical protein [Bacilli bacterium]